jgi:hypothetical protein
MPPTFDCKDCGERYVSIPHQCRVAQDLHRAPVLVKRDVLADVTIAERPAVGDTNTDTKGSGARWNQDKAPMEFIPLHLLAETAEVFHLVTTRKIRPYPMWNWANGMPWLVPYACLVRHLAAWFCGEEFDTGPNGSGKRHTAHMMCNLLMMIHYEQTFPEGDNRPKRWFGRSEEEKKDA